MSDGELLTSVQEATFRYFWDYAHPGSGLIRERSGFGDCCATGGTGFGLLALMVGTERGFASRDAVAGAPGQSWLFSKTGPSASMRTSRTGSMATLERPCRFRLMTTVRISSKPLS